MRIRKAMSSPLVTATPETSVRQAALLMQQRAIGALPIVSAGELVGIVTDRDLVTRVLAVAPQMDDVPVSRAMSERPMTCFSDQEVAEAAVVMGDLQLRRLVVLDRNRALVGMLSLGDIAEDVSEVLAGETLGEISEFR